MLRMKYKVSFIFGLNHCCFLGKLFLNAIFVLHVLYVVSIIRCFCEYWPKRLFIKEVGLIARLLVITELYIFIYWKTLKAKILA